MIELFLSEIALIRAALVSYETMLMSKGIGKDTELRKEIEELRIKLKGINDEESN